MSAETMEWLNTFQLIGFTDPTYGRGEAWHKDEAMQKRLGLEQNHYPNAVPVDDVLRRLFNWQAIEADIVIRAKDQFGRIIESVDRTRKAIVRSDDPSTVFNVFKSSYTVHQYEEWLLKNVANIIDDSDLAIGTAGLLRRGGRAYVTVELPETVKTPMGFDIRPHLLACTSHDGTLSTTFQLVSTIVVCDNTLAGALGESTPQFKVRHSKHSIGRLQNVRDALTLVHEYTDDLMLELERLSTQEVTDNEFKAIVEHLFPVDLSIEARPQAQSRAQNKQDLIKHLYASDPRVTPWTGTKLGVYQAFNTYAHWYAGTDKNRAERNAMNGIYGRTAEFDQQVLATIDSLVGV